MPSSYEIPAFGTKVDDLLGWMKEAVSEGDIWLSAQKPTVEWSEVLDVLGPKYLSGAGDLRGESSVGYNLVRSVFTEVRATMANFRHAGEFVTTEDDAQALFDRAHMLTNVDRHWEETTFNNLVHRDAIALALAKGTSYIYQDWDRAKWGPKIGDIRQRVFDPSDVTFIQLPKSHDLQQAYVVLIKEELPLQLAKRMYAYNPAFSNALRADRDSPGWIQKGLDRVQQFISPVLRSAGSIRKANDSYPTCFVWHAYTMDNSINERDHAVTMGVEGTNWTYEVPYLGKPIGQGVTNPATGQEWTLPATPEDCLMFPLRRLTIFSNTGVCYDNTSPWWHGCVPLARLRFNDRPWEALGASQVGDAITMQKGIIEIMRLTEDSAAARMDPPAGYDENRMDKGAAEAINPRKAGVRFAYDATLGMPISYPFPPQFYDVPAWIIGQGGFVMQQEERIRKICASTDFVAISKARQIPGSDTLEKLMEMAGPVVQDMVSALVEPLTQLGEWRKALYFQFYTRSRMVAIADPEGENLTTGTEIVPTAFKPKQQMVKFTPASILPEIKGESMQARQDRGKNSLHEFRYKVSESGINEIHRMSTKLLYLQLKKSGFPLSDHTLSQVCQIPNFGPRAKGVNTEFEQWVAEQRIKMELQIEMSKEVALATGGAGGAPPAIGGEGEGAGRPPSFNAPPRLVQKDGGTRSTVTTS